ncbi:hypothetical protein BH09CHL1_BH09CHL1_04780 [soil metagenome]
MNHQRSKERPNSVRRIAQAFLIVLLAFAVIGSIGQIRTAQAAEPTAVTIHVHECPTDYNSDAIGADPLGDCTAVGVGNTITQTNAVNTVIDAQTTSAVNAGTVAFTIPNGENHTFTQATTSDAQFISCEATNTANGATATLSHTGNVLSFNSTSFDLLECDWFNVQLSAVQPVPGITLVKTADDYSVVAGDTITYTFTVTNTGTAPLENVVLDDSLPNLQWIDGPELGSLPATDSVAIGTATYLVTQADVEIGEVRNFASVEAEPVPCLYCDAAYSEDDVIVDVVRVGAITIEKTADVTEAKLGDTIIYTVRIKNTGDFDLINIKVEDPLPGLVWLNAQKYDMLSVGEERVLHAEYTVTQADIDARSIHNVATVSGEILNDCHICEVTSATDDAIVITATQATPVVDPCTNEMATFSGVRSLQPAPATPVVDEITPEATAEPEIDATPTIEIDETPAPVPTMEPGCPSPTPTTPGIPVVTDLPSTGASAGDNRDDIGWIGIGILFCAAGALIVGSTTKRRNAR